MPETQREKLVSGKTNKEVNIANKKLTKLLVLNGTRAPPQEEDKREKQQQTKGAIYAANSTKPIPFLGTKKMQKIGQLGG